MKAWTLAVARDDLTNTSLIEEDVPEVGTGEALLRVAQGEKIGTLVTSA